MIKKTFTVTLLCFAAVAFAQNTRVTLRETLNKLYSDIENECSADLNKLDNKYKAIVQKSPGKKLSKTDEKEYLKQFEVLKSSYNKCKNKNQTQKIESLKTLLAKVEAENKTVYTSKKNTLLPVAEPFSLEIIRSKLSHLLSGNELFENLNESLRLRLNFILDTDGVTKEVQLTGTDNEEIKLFTALIFYSIPKVFQPAISNGKIVKERYSLPLTFVTTE